ncbi:uncharacterized protein LOC125647792 isoform X2 [Ostrea edulis]|uniref:uncharacterized protein LOC125647792 isoform X2 n=1 Tax=Ostrea edulis TaxID=37623 RepID=UPI0024AF4AAA|nr:uncharacterized protein LOC125647792 isoform X2 [Ostrea edulis]
MADKGHEGDEWDLPKLSFGDEASMTDLHKLNLRDDDRYSSTEDDFPGKSSDDEHERASDVRDGQSFDNVNRRSTSGIVRRVRTGPSTSSAVTARIHSSEQAQVALSTSSPDDDEDVDRSRSRGVHSTPRIGPPPGTFGEFEEAQAPIHQGYYTTSVVPPTPRESMEGVEFNSGWKEQIKSPSNENIEDEPLFSSSENSDDNIEENIEIPEIILADTHLGHDIVVTHPVTYEIGDYFACRPWPLSRRISEGVDITLDFQEVTCCDVFEVYIKGGKRGVLQFNHKDKEHIIFSVRIKHLFRSGSVTYVARIKQSTGWESVSAELKNEKVTFSTTELESMYVICFPTKSRHIIQKQGSEIGDKSEGDKLLFPPNFVDRPEPTSIQFTAVDKEGMDERNKLYPDLFKLKALSRRMYIEHDILQISKSMLATLSLETIGAKNYNLKDLEIVCFRWKDGEVTLMSPEECSAQMVKGNTVDTQTKGVVNKSGVSVGLALPGFTERHVNEIKLAYRDEYLCKFFMHIKVLGVRTAIVSVDCVKLEDIRTLEKKYVTVFRVGVSDNVYLRDFQRIRIDVSGSSYRQNESENRFLYFFASSETNHLNFKINQHQGLGISPSTILKFNIDNGPKRVVIHQQDFDPWTLPIGEKTEAGQRKVNQITRGNTMVDMFKSK